MSWFKKFIIILMSFLPVSALAVAPFVVVLAAGGIAVTGVSIYRSLAPVDMQKSFEFFSSCWTCELFSNIMTVLSNILPKVYSALGTIIIPVAIGLTAVWVAWYVFSGFVGSNAKFNLDGWTIGGTFGTHAIKLGVLIALLFAPVPRLITNIVIEPVFNVGLSMSHVINKITPESAENYTKCIISTAIIESQVAGGNDERGAYSPNLRHSLACELAKIHQITGLGMTVGWTMLNMAFDIEYMHKLLWTIPVVPNIPLLFAGLLIFVLFFMALLPIPLYFLEVFVKLSMDLIMLPLMLLSWLFSGWKIFPSGGQNIKKTIDEVISGAIGIAMTCIFLVFALMFLNAVFSGDSTSVLMNAINNNDSKYFIDSIMLNNSSFITTVLMGIFITMFMIMIPALIKTIFNVSISQKYYDTAKKDIGILWKDIKKVASALKK
ncbi:MAG: hypothetical protein ACLRFI_00080 [Alphaproteobacteria bacterium]